MRPKDPPGGSKRHSGSSKDSLRRLPGHGFARFLALFFDIRSLFFVDASLRASGLQEASAGDAKVINCLKLKPGDNVADIGVGTGYIAWRMAKKIGPKGTVYGVDIQPEMLEHLKRNMGKRGLANVKGVMGTIKNPKLPPNSIDLSIMVDVYHEFSFPHEMMQGIVNSLKPGGRVVFVEYRAEDPKVPIKKLHKMSIAQVKKEAALFPLKHVETYKKLPWQHVIFFEKVAK